MSRKGMAKADKCTNKIWRAKDLEGVVWDVLEELDYNEVSAPKSNHKEKKTLQKELKKVDSQIEKLVELYSLDGIPQDVLRKQMDSLNQKKDALLDQIYRLQDQPPVLSEKEVREKQKSLQAIKIADVETQRAFLASMIDTITLLPSHDLEFRWKF